MAVLHADVTTIVLMHPHRASVGGLTPIHDALALRCQSTLEEVKTVQEFSSSDAK